MPKTINLKCLECSKVSRSVFTVNHPACYDGVNCRRRRSYYRNHEENKLKEHRWHRYLKFRSDTCFVCGSMDALETHHVIAQSSGGKDTAENVLTLCSSCHRVITLFERKLGVAQKSKARWVVSAEKYPLGVDSPAPE